MAIAIHEPPRIRGKADDSIGGKPRQAASLLEGVGIAKGYAAGQFNSQNGPTVCCELSGAEPQPKAAREDLVSEMAGRFVQVPEVNRSVLATTGQGPAVRG